jgi:hypothetical protein
MAQRKSNKGRIAAGVGAALAAGAAAAAGYYFYGSSKAKKHRGDAARWAGDMKKEVMKEARGLKKVTAKDFAKIVEAVSATYLKAKKIDTTELEQAAQELKSNWKKVKSELGHTGRTAASRARATGSRARKAVAKTAKKSFKRPRTRARTSR